MLEKKMSVTTTDAILRKGNLMFYGLRVTTLLWKWLQLYVESCHDWSELRRSLGSISY